ncbi:hypothetical protein CA982_21270 [Gordonia lacunae]|uniref:Uncharacterized protein n=1 Tax=Gordonia lacunae TaxID=417102 RepID=A0A243Q5E3_9ACTN|nr:hypothetical protein CA982_21270 [Gordonia lacunae]
MRMTRVTPSAGLCDSGISASSGPAPGVEVTGTESGAASGTAAFWVGSHGDGSVAEVSKGGRDNEAGSVGSPPPVGVVIGRLSRAARSGDAAGRCMHAQPAVPCAQRSEKGLRTGAKSMITTPIGPIFVQ